MHVSAVQPEASRILLDVILDVSITMEFFSHEYAIIWRNNGDNLSRFDDDDSNIDLRNFCRMCLTEDELDYDPSS